MGTTVATPTVREDFAKVKVRTELEYPDGTDCKDIRLKLSCVPRRDKKWRSAETVLSLYDEGVLEQDFVVDRPLLWDCEHPNLYRADTEVYYQGRLSDTYQTTFGIRTIEVVPEKRLPVERGKGWSSAARATITTWDRWARR